MNLNRASLIGRITRDPELKTTPTGVKVANFSVATNYSYKDKSNNKVEKTQFHNCVVWGRLAEVISTYAVKGQEVLVGGRIETREWTKKDGSKAYITEIIVTDFGFGSKPKGASNVAEESHIDPPEEDIPSIQVGEGEIDPEELHF